MTPPPLTYAERAAEGEPRGLLVLHHGRGADEQDLLALADVLDPARRMHVVSPRAPLTPPGSSGYHWYLVPRVGFPDPATFQEAFESLAELHDELWESTGIGPERTVLGGFSMGAVMSYSLALAANRPAAAGIMAFSGFIPTVAGWEADIAARSDLRVFIAHGARDPVISIDFARQAAAVLREGGLRVDYQEGEGSHHIDPSQLEPARAWLAETLPAAALGT
jgi:phospholipase/carboxylesterase